MNITEKTSPIWTETEWEKFRNVVAERFPLLLGAFELMYYCGLRANEVLALSSSDIDFENKTVNVDKGLKQVTTSTRLSNDITVSFECYEPNYLIVSSRIISIPDDVVNLLKGLLGLDCHLFGPRIFSVSERKFYAFFSDCAKEAGIPKQKRTGIYVLRKCYRARNGGKA